MNVSRCCALIVVLLASPASAQTSKQSVQQSGNVTAGHIPWWITSGVIGDGGSSADSPITSLGVTNNGGNGVCVSSARQTAAGRNQLCLGASTSSPAVISLQNYGTAPAESLTFVINGAAQGFPTVSPLPVTNGDLACFSTTGGALKDCGSGPSTNPLVVGTTPIAGGITQGLLFDNAGALGNLATTNNGVLSTNGLGVPAVSATLPNGLALGTPGSGVATNLTGTASGLTAGTVTTNANLTGDVTSVGNASTYGNVVPAAKGGAGTVNGALKANGSGTVTQAACADLSNSAASCSTDTTNATNISSGVLAAARGGAGAVSGALKANGSGTVTQAACADLSNGTGACSATYTAPGSWTPADNSGASLVFTGVNANYTQIGNIIFAYASFTYPSTVNGSTTSIKGFPVNFSSQQYGRQCTLTGSGSSTPIEFLPDASAATGSFRTAGLGTVTNAQMSLAVVFLFCIYPAS